MKSRPLGGRTGSVQAPATTTHGRRRQLGCLFGCDVVGGEVGPDEQRLRSHPGTRFPRSIPRFPPFDRARRCAQDLPVAGAEVRPPRSRHLRYRRPCLHGLLSRGESCRMRALRRGAGPWARSTTGRTHDRPRRRACLVGKAHRSTRPSTCRAGRRPPRRGRRAAWASAGQTAGRGHRRMRVRERDRDRYVRHRDARLGADADSSSTRSRFAGPRDSTRRRAPRASRHAAPTDRTRLRRSIEVLDRYRPVSQTLRQWTPDERAPFPCRSSTGVLWKTPRNMQLANALWRARENPNVS